LSGISAHPVVVPDEGRFGISGETNGTEGFSPSGSVGHDLGGPGSPSTDGLGGIEGGPELVGGWLGGGNESNIFTIVLG